MSFNKEMSYYDKISEVMDQCGCQMITTEHEFTEIKKTTRFPKVTYVASCGHESSVHVNVFLNRKTGVKCPECVSIANGKSKKGKMTCEDGQCVFIKMEDDGIDYLQSILSNDFVIWKTKEGCLADMVIKPKSVEEDRWLSVQVKTTTKSSRDYGFSCGSKYKNCIVICLCVSDKKMWILDGNDITTKFKIAIGLKKSKYDKNEVNMETIQTTIHDYYHTLPLISLQDANIPQSEFQKREQDFRKYVETRCHFLPFEYPNRNQLVYDFKVNGFKVQEKVGSYRKDRDNSIIFCLCKSNGKENRIRKFQPYCKGDNDFYWLNFPDKKHVYVFPESELINHGTIATEKQNGTRFVSIVLSNIESSKYDKKYLFDYDNLDKTRMKELFSI